MIANKIHKHTHAQTNYGGNSTPRILIFRRFKTASRLKQRGTFFRKCFIDALLGCGFWVSKLSHTITKSGTVAGTACIDDFAQRTSTIVTANEIVEVSRAPDVLIKFGDIIKSRDNVAVWNDVKSQRVQSVLGDRWIK